MYWLQFVVIGIALGSVYGLVAQGIVFVYRGTGVLNFAHMALALLATSLFWDLTAGSWSWPYWPGLVVGLLSAGALGGLIGLAMRVVQAQTRATKSVLTIGALLAFQTLTHIVFPNAADTAKLLPSPFPRSPAVSSAGVYVSWIYLGIIATSIVAAAALALSLRRTKVGVALRALSDSEVGAQLVGMNVVRAQVGIWVVGAMMAALAAALVIPLYFVDDIFFINLLVRGLAAGLLGGFISFSGAFAGGLVIGLSEALAGASHVGWLSAASFRESLPFILIGLWVVARGRRFEWGNGRGEEVVA